MATPAPKSFFRRVALPTLIVAGGTTLGFWYQARMIDDYKATQLRLINDQLDAEERAEYAARMAKFNPPADKPKPSDPTNNAKK